MIHRHNPFSIYTFFFRLSSSSSKHRSHFVLNWHWNWVSQRDWFNWISSQYSFVVPVPVFSRVRRAQCWFSYDRPDRLCHFCRLQSLRWLEQANFLKRQKRQRRSGRSYENQALQKIRQKFSIFKKEVFLLLQTLFQNNTWRCTNYFDFAPCKKIQEIQVF